MSFADFLNTVFTGTNLSLLGAALATLLACMGSAKGIGLVAEATSGLLSEDPSKFGKSLILMLLPGTQGIYGFATAFMILINNGVLGGNTLTTNQGFFMLIAALPIAIVGYFSAIKQGRVAAAGISLISKRPGELVHGIISAALVETYAVFALLVSILMVVNLK